RRTSAPGPPPPPAGQHPASAAPGRPAQLAAASPGPHGRPRGRHRARCGQWKAPHGSGCAGRWRLRSAPPDGPASRLGPRAPAAAAPTPDGAPPGRRPGPGAPDAAREGEGLHPAGAGAGAAYPSSMKKEEIEIPRPQKR
ncbi:hypothetical protein BS78_01G125800, partial [Paspalum vaginatum]